VLESDIKAPQAGLTYSFAGALAAKAAVYWPIICSPDRQFDVFFGLYINQTLAIIPRLRKN